MDDDDPTYDPDVEAFLDNIEKEMWETYLISHNLGSDPFDTQVLEPVDFLPSGSDAPEPPF